MRGNDAQSRLLKFLSINASLIATVEFYILHWTFKPQNVEL